MPRQLCGTITIIKHSVHFMSIRHSMRPPLSCIHSLRRETAILSAKSSHQLRIHWPVWEVVCSQVPIICIYWLLVFSVDFFHSRCLLNERHVWPLIGFFIFLCLYSYFLFDCISLFLSFLLPFAHSLSRDFAVHAVSPLFRGCQKIMYSRTLYVLSVIKTVT